MRAVVTRVASASVQVDGVTVGAIERGFLILLGVGPRDGEAQCKALADKILGLRVFEDEKGKMNLGLEQVGGQVLVVSQFTLYGNCRKGRRPSFMEAAPPELGEAMYEGFLELCREAGVTMTGAGATYPYGVDPADSNIRIAPSLPPVAELEQAAQVLCTCLRLAALEKLGV